MLCMQGGLSHQAFESFKYLLGKVGAEGAMTGSLRPGSDPHCSPSAPRTASQSIPLTG